MTKQPSVLDNETFIQYIKDAYRHLYDLVYLRSHPLADYLIDEPLQRKEQAWQLHHCLLTVIDELDPGPEAPAFSPEWRRHRLMVLRYVEGLNPQEIADTLCISRRHYYREQDAVVDAVANILWSRHVSNMSCKVIPTITENEPLPARIELLRQEAAQSASKVLAANLDQIIEGVLSLFTELARQKNIVLSAKLSAALPAITVDPLFLRQILIGLLGYWLEHTQQATITLDAKVDRSGVWLSAVVTPPSVAFLTDDIETDEQLITVQELAFLNHVQIQIIHHNPILSGFYLLLPHRQQHTVLVIDDNQDTLHLFRRYLVPNYYNVITASTGKEAISFAQQTPPDLIVLDLMMPYQDGWDLLQVFRSRKETQGTPVVVCSVLRQRDLALALGATAFLEKPIGREMLLHTLHSLVQR